MKRGKEQKAPEERIGKWFLEAGSRLVLRGYFRPALFLPALPATAEDLPRVC